MYLVKLPRCIFKSKRDRLMATQSVCVSLIYAIRKWYLNMMYKDDVDFAAIIHMFLSGTQCTYRYIFKGCEL